jgi:hypothetical protein
MPPTVKKPVLLFFREVLRGDIKKFQLKSNKAPTGGGARDLRLSKEIGLSQEIGPKIGSMFPTKTKKPGITTGTISWEDPSGQVKHTAIELWRPTGVRPTETRIGRIYKIESWAVDEAEFEKAKKQDQKWFFLLVKDDQGNVWARLLEEKNLDGETDIVRDFIKKRMQETKGNNAVCGVIDFENNEVFPR